MLRDRQSRIKKLAYLEDECRRFDVILDDLQKSVYYSYHTNDYEFSLYTRAQSVRDELFRFVRKIRAIPDETDPNDFDIGGGSVLRTDEGGEIW